jgi:hypothetical protein
MKKHPRNNGRLDLWLKVLLAITVLLAGTKFFLTMDSQENQPPDSRENFLRERIDFAKCLMEKGWIMYGVDTCEFCQTQKKMFGEAFDRIHYVNCDFDQAVCQKMGLSLYPVWGNGPQLLTGIQTYAQLATVSGCKIPKIIQ